MGPGNKSNKVKHFQTLENKKIHGPSTKREKINFSSKQKQKEVVKLVQIIEKSVMHVIQGNI